MMNPYVITKLVFPRSLYCSSQNSSGLKHRTNELIQTPYQPVVTFRQ